MRREKVREKVAVSREVEGREVVLDLGADEKVEGGGHGVERIDATRTRRDVSRTRQGVSRTRQGVSRTGRLAGR